MSKFANKKFWVDTLDRAIATFAQGLLGVLGAGGLGILDVDWTQALSVAGMVTVLSILTSVAFRGRDDSLVGTAGA